MYLYTIYLLKQVERYLGLEIGHTLYRIVGSFVNEFAQKPDKRTFFILVPFHYMSCRDIVSFLNRPRFRGPCRLF